MAKAAKQASAKQAAWLSVLASLISTLFVSSIFGDQPAGASVSQAQATRAIAFILVVITGIAAVITLSFLFNLLILDGHDNTARTYIIAAFFGLLTLVLSILSLRGLKGLPS